MNKEELKEALEELLPAILADMLPSAIKEARSQAQKKDKPTLSYNDEHVKQAEWMAEPVIARYPKMTIDIGVWSDAIRRLQEIDKKTTEEIKRVWLFIQNYENGDFNWHSNIRTPMKLRKKKDGLSYFDKIDQQLNSRYGPGQSSPVNNPDFYI